MTNFILPPSPNWHQSNILACNENGLLAYGSRNEIIVVNLKPDGKFDVTFLNVPSKDKINVVVFSPIYGSFKNCLAACGDDGIVRLWDFKESRLLYCHSGHKEGVRVLGLDWSRADTNRVVSVNDLGTIVCWDLASNTIRKLVCGIKVLPLCLACCPHDQDLVAVGCKGGATLVINIKGVGKINHRLRGQEQDIISLSWCPVPYNVIKYKRNCISKDEGEVNKKEESEAKSQDLLLATGATDKSIFIWRAGTDGRYEVALPLPNNNITAAASTVPGFRKRVTNSGMIWICVRWVDAYTLLSTSQFAELILWDLDKIHASNKGKKPLPNLLHACHYKGCFSIACPVVYDVVDDWKADTRVVWTTAMDKHMIACSLAKGNVVLDIPTVGGVVYSMALSSLDPNRLAIGSSDSKVFVWNMSNVHALHITTYWKKIIGRVMALCWHPTEENWLAYATNDGHVGLLDVSSNKIPTLFRLHHRKAVYQLCWAPPFVKPGEAKLVLYSVGDGDVFQYTADPLQPDAEPISLNSEVLNRIDQSLGLQKCLDRSDVIFKPDHTCLAVGNENGSVYIVDRETLTLKHAIYPHKKLMNNLEWHPETVAGDNHISQYKDWLAISCDNIKVYNIPSEGTPELVATLSGHSEKVVGLAWSPHLNGRLLSASYDNSVQIWDVPSQSCLGIYLSHHMSVMCAVFSPLDPDIVISGSTDNTVRLWNISELSAPVAKPSRKRSGHKEKTGAAEATDLTLSEDICEGSDSAVHASVINRGTEDYKRRQKNRAMFPTTGPKLTQAKHFDILLQLRAASFPHIPSVPPSNNEEVPSALDLGYLDFFGDENAMRRLLMVEESSLVENGQYSLAQQSALWRGDVSQMIKEAITKKKLSDWLVSVAPLAGFDVWEEVCIAYSNQLVDSGNLVKASTYLLVANKVHEAVKLLMDYKMFKEAIAIAKCRLPADDPLIATVYTEWGDFIKLNGSFNLAAHCYLAANNTQACIETLSRIKELKSLKLAAVLARQVGLTEQANSLAVECLTMSVLAGNVSVGHQLIAEIPQYQFWLVWLHASELLAKVKNHNELEVFDWLEGRQQGRLSLSDELISLCSSIGQVYNKLVPHLPKNKSPEYERDMWCYVSGQLAAAYAARLEASHAQFLHHMVLALSAAFHFQTRHPTCLALPLTVILITPAGLFSEESILTKEYETNEEKQLTKSIKAFVCASIILWMNSNWKKVTKMRSTSKETPLDKGSGDSVGECLRYKMCWLPELLNNCSADVLDAENVSFFVKMAQKKQLLDTVTNENIKKKIVENTVEGGSENKSKQKSIKERTDNGKTVDSYNEGHVNRSTEGNKLLESTLVDTVDKEISGTAAETKHLQEVHNVPVKYNVDQVTRSTEDTKPVDSLLVDTADKGDYGIVTETKQLQEVQDKPVKYNVDQVTRDTEDNKSLVNITDKWNSGEATETKPLQDVPVKYNLNEVTENIKMDKPVDSVLVDFADKMNLGAPETKHLQEVQGAPVKGKSLEEAFKIKVDKIESQNIDVATFIAERKEMLKTDKVSENGESVVASNVSQETGDDTEASSSVCNGGLNGSCNDGKTETETSSLLRKIKELDQVLQRFEAERVSVPCPFTAYMNIKYLIDNLISKQDPTLAKILQDKCDRVWKKSHQ